MQFNSRKIPPAYMVVSFIKQRMFMSKITPDSVQESKKPSMITTVLVSRDTTTILENSLVLPIAEPKTVMDEERVGYNKETEMFEQKKEVLPWDKQEPVISKTMERREPPKYYGAKDDLYEYDKVAVAWGLNNNAHLYTAGKYIKRAGLKTIDPISDIQKAIDFLLMELERIKPLPY